MKKMEKNVVTRFAPSPTGYMHIGNLRTALYSYLTARSYNGKFILRIEDTDRERLVEGAVEVIYDTLCDANLKYDEGPDIGGPNAPYVQSERRGIYLEYAQKLVESGHAYYCFCSKERLDSVHETGGGYDRHCRDLSVDETEKRLSAGEPYVVRQRIPLSGSTSYVDEVFGTISIDNREIQDMVLLKGDGYPTYNFAHIVDDHLMGITHVVRGCEYLTSTPAYALIYDAFGWERPSYIHLPLIMGRNEDGSISKLSKRHGSVSFQELLREGYLPEAVINYIAFLGWSPKSLNLNKEDACEANREIFSLDELSRYFRTDEINKSEAVFDFDKLLWFNGIYIRGLSLSDFISVARPYLKELEEQRFSLEKIAALIQVRVEKLSEIPDKTAFFCRLTEFDSELYVNKKNKITLENAPELLQQAIAVLEHAEVWENDSLFSCLGGLAERLEVKAGAVMWVVRIAVSGVVATPGGATEILEIIGREESLKRLKTSYGRLINNK